MLTNPSTLEDNNKFTRVRYICEETYFRNSSDDKLLWYNNTFLLQKLLSCIHRSYHCLLFFYIRAKCIKIRLPRLLQTLVIGNRKSIFGSLPFEMINWHHVHALSPFSVSSVFDGSPLERMVRNKNSFTIQDKTYHKTHRLIGDLSNTDDNTAGGQR